MINFLSYSFNKLNINGKEVLLPATIDKILIFNSKIITHLSTREVESENFDTARNIFAVNQNGKILWQIEAPHRDGKKFERVCYGNIWIDSDGKLKAGDSVAHDFDIDPETGKVSNPVFTK